MIELLGGKSSPAVGGSVGMDRLIMLIKERNINLGIKPKAKIFLVNAGVVAKKKALSLIEKLRKAGLDVVESLGKESFKAQLRAADKMQSPLALILGQKEVFEETIIVRDMRTGVQETVPFEKIVETVKKKLR